MLLYEMTMLCYDMVYLFLTEDLIVFGRFFFLILSFFPYFVYTISQNLLGDLYEIFRSHRY